MKKAIRFTYLLALYIIGFSIIAMAVTYLGEYLRTTNFFGDTPALKPGTDGCDPLHDWGPRHYWYNFTCFFLAVLSILRILIWAVWYWDSEK